MFWGGGIAWLGLQPFRNWYGCLLSDAADTCRTHSTEEIKTHWPLPHLFKPIHIDFDASTPYAVMEGVKAPSSVIHIRDVMQSNQQPYCSNPVPELPRSFGSVQALQHVSLYGPVDSYMLSLLHDIGSFQGHLTKDMLWAIWQYKTPMQSPANLLC